MGTIQWQFVKIELAPADVECFKKFQEHYNEFCILEANGFFTFKGGSASIDRDKDGILQSIKINDIRYKRTKK